MVTMPTDKFLFCLSLFLIMATVQYLHAYLDHRNQKRGRLTDLARFVVQIVGCIIGVFHPWEQSRLLIVWTFLLIIILLGVSCVYYAQMEEHG